MDKKNSSKLNINLSTSGKATVGRVVYGWTIDAGRAIIVLIELVALAALGYRFVIDRQIVDLKDQIEVQEAYIAAQADEEKEFRSIQERLQGIKLVNEETQSKIQVMNEILDAISSGTFFTTSLSINEQSIALNGNTFSLYTLTDFLEGLKSFPSVVAISIDEISTSNDGIKFSTRVQVKDTTLPGEEI